MKGFPWCAVLLACLAVTGCEHDTRLSIFAAASMGPTLDVAGKLYERAHPGVRVEVELSSSRLACIKVSDQGRIPDVVLSADDRLMRELLVPSHADDVTLFATNRLVIASVRDGAIAKRLANEPWQLVLADPTVRTGIADPAQAPVGARALEALRLNDEIVGDPQLALGATIARRIGPQRQRPDVSKLIAPLETGEIDAAFVYATEASQYGFNATGLDPRIDGSATTFYALAIPREAPHPDVARDFVSYLIDGAGRAVAIDKHLQLLDAPRVVGGAP